MGETTRGPPGRNAPGRNAKRCPGETDSAISQKNQSTPSLNNRDAQQPQRRIFSRPDTPIEVLREENRRRARLTALLRLVYRRGERVTVELGLLFAELLDAEDLLEELATRFGCFDQSFLRDRIGNEFPPPPVRVVGGRDR
jgi:hypothetical protein